MKKILLTGLAATNAKAMKLIEERNHIALNFPMQEMKLVQKYTIPKEKFDWLIFTSATAVKFFYNLYPNYASPQVASVGPATSQELESHKVTINLQPKENYSALGVADLFKQLKPVKTLYPCSKLANNTLVDLLSKAGHEVVRSDLYEPVETQNHELPEFTDIAFFSKSGVDLFYKNFGKESLQNKNAVAIGKSTATAFENLYGCWPKVPKESTVTGVVNEIL